MGRPRKRKPRPTGDCYRAAAEWASHEWSANRRDGIFVVHGLVTNLKGKRFMHAWCEFDDKVVDLTTAGPDKPVDKTHWYSLVQAEPISRYTAEEACINSIRHGHWGPWDAESA